PAAGRLRPRTGAAQSRCRGDIGAAVDGVALSAAAARRPFQRAAGRRGIGRNGHAAASRPASRRRATVVTTLILTIGAVWLLAILGGSPLYAAMGLAAFAFAYHGGFPPSIVAQKMIQGANSFPLVAAPIFILMGNILTGARINDRIVAFATALVGWLRGGYAHASIIASMIFAGMVGSAVADAAGVGAIEIKSMRRVGYKPETAAAITAASATIGPIIPPSLPMVIYGVTADVSIGRLFLAGFVPGV